MACNKGHRTIDGKGIPQPAAPKVGEVGLAEVSYNGYYDLVEHCGEVTGKVYTFGLEKSTAYVDSRDAAGLILAVEDGRHVFEVIG